MVLQGHIYTSVTLWMVLCVYWDIFVSIVMIISGVYLCHCVPLLCVFLWTIQALLVDYIPQISFTTLGRGCELTNHFMNINSSLLHVCGIRQLNSLALLRHTTYFKIQTMHHIWVGVEACCYEKRIFIPQLSVFFSHIHLSQGALSYHVVYLMFYIRRDSITILYLRALLQWKRYNNHFVCTVWFVYFYVFFFSWNTECCYCVYVFFWWCSLIRSLVMLISR